MNSLCKILIALLIFTACSHKKSVNYIEKFPIETTLTGVVPVVEDTMLNITDMKVIDNYLVCYDVYNVWDYFLKVYDINSLELLASWGKRGRGPYQVANPGYLVYNHTNKTIGIEDWGKDKMFVFNIDSLVKTVDYVPHIVPFSHGVFNNALQREIVNDTIMYVCGSIAADLVYSTKDGEIINQIKTDFYNDKDYPMPGLGTITQNIFVYNEAKGIFAFPYIRYDRVTFYDVRHDNAWSVVGPDRLSPKAEFHESGTLENFWEEKLAYISGISTDEYVFLNYSGIKCGETEPGGSHSFNLPDKIHIFDWEGNPIANIQLDNRVRSIAYIKHKKLLIASDPESYAPFVVYDLSKILD